MLEDLKDADLFNYLAKAAANVGKIFGDVLDPVNFPLVHYVQNYRMVVCKRDGVPIGVHLSRLYPSILDPKTKILYQDLLYAEPGTRAAKLLMEDFLTFGRANANHIITCISPRTNIKRQSLEKLGFSKMEELYRMEIKK